MEEKDFENPGDCLGNYNEEAEECKVCDIIDECKKETNGGNNGSNL